MSRTDDPGEGSRGPAGLGVFAMYQQRAAAQREQDAEHQRGAEGRQASIDPPRVRSTVRKIPVVMDGQIVGWAYEGSAEAVERAVRHFSTAQRPVRFAQAERGVVSDAPSTAVPGAEVHRNPGTLSAAENAETQSGSPFGDSRAEADAIADYANYLADKEAQAQADRMARYAENARRVVERIATMPLRMLQGIAEDVDTVLKNPISQDLGPLSTDEVYTPPAIAPAFRLAMVPSLGIVGRTPAAAGEAVLGAGGKRPPKGGSASGGSGPSGGHTSATPGGAAPAGAKPSPIPGATWSNKSGKGTGIWQKRGDYNDALKDFDKRIDPATKKDHGRGVYTGVTPDGATLTVRPRSSKGVSYPTIDVNRPGRRMQKIRYIP